MTRVQTLTPAESRAVIALWGEIRTAVHAAFATADAETIDIWIKTNYPLHPWLVGEARHYLAGAA